MGTARSIRCLIRVSPGALFPRGEGNETLPYCFSGFSSRITGRKAGVQAEWVSGRGFRNLKLNWSEGLARCLKHNSISANWR